MTVAITDLTTRTEAYHTVHAERPHGAVSPYYLGPKTYLRPNEIIASYRCHTDSDHADWACTHIQLRGRQVAADGTPNLTVATPATSHVVPAGDAPLWATRFILASWPYQVQLTLPGHDQPLPGFGDTQQPADGLYPHVARRTEVRHTVHAASITDADPLRVPDPATPAWPDRWMLPEELSITYRQALNTYEPSHWQLHNIAVNGQWVTENGEPDPYNLPPARWPENQPTPNWLRAFITRHRPACNTGALIPTPTPTPTTITESPLATDGHASPSNPRSACG